MKTLRALWELTRLEHGVMLFMAVLIGALIAGKGFPDFAPLFFAFLTVMLLEASTFALNDYFDYELDKHNNRQDRPLVRGDVPPSTALLVAVLLFPLGIVAAWFVNPICFTIALITGIFSLVYDIWLKKVKIIGNFFIAYTMAIPFVFGGTAVSSSIPPVVYLLAGIAFLAGSGREIMKDVMDFEGDSKKGVRSFPKYIGIRASNTVAALFYLVAVVISFVPFAVAVDPAYYQNYAYLAIVLITDGMLIYTATHLIFKDDVSMDFHRKFTLLAIFIGLLAFLAGAFVA